MAKTDFANGTIVTPEFLDSIFFTGGGHVHDGGTDDGHSSKVDLTAHVTGKLPAGNLGDHNHDGGGVGKIVLAGAAEVTGRLPTANYIYPRGYIDGLLLERSDGDPSNDIKINKGTCVSTDETTVMGVGASFAKQIDNTWVAGTSCSPHARG